MMGNARFRLTGRRVALVLMGSLVAALLGFYLFDSPSVDSVYGSIRRIRKDFSPTKG